MKKDLYLMIKLCFVLSIGILVGFYNLMNFNVFTKDSNILVEALLQGHINTVDGKSLIGIYFDYSLNFLFNINLYDASTYLKIFGL